MAAADSGAPEASATALVVAPRLPLSDKRLNLQALSTLISSAQTREKALKILQYASKLAGYLLARAVRDLFWAKHCDGLAKNLSTARRFFKFFRWLKHFEDIADARAEAEKSPAFSRLLYMDIACNLAADISEDFTSLEKVGILPKGRLPKRTEYYSNWCQLVLAVVEIAVSYVKASRTRASASKQVTPTLATQRKVAMANLELSKFLADLGKAFWDCELSFASEFAFCVCGLWAALVSTHKYAVKALK